LFGYKRVKKMWFDTVLTARCLWFSLSRERERPTRHTVPAHIAQRQSLGVRVRRVLLVDSSQGLVWM
jgi:hypothetical protein